MKLNVGPLRYMSKEDFNVLSAIEMGSRNHKVVPMRLIGQLSKMRPGGVNKAIGELQRLRLVTKEHSGSGSSYEGVILGYGGYDYLALKVLAARGSVAGVGRQIGVGKESDIYEVFREHEASSPSFPCVMKIQRLGRTSFRTVKSNRDYIGKRKHYSWLYLSKLAATKEYAFMLALHEHQFPVPVPVDHSRHIICMQQILGIRLDELRYDHVPGEDDAAKMAFLESKRTECLDLIIRLAQHGLIHGDFNEFNLLIEDHSFRIVMIDFPQMVSTSHPNAIDYFNRDVDGVCVFFERRFGMSPPDVPDLASIVSLVDLDKQLKASGNNNVSHDDIDGDDDDDDDDHSNNSSDDEIKSSE